MCEGPVSNEPSQLIKTCCSSSTSEPGSSNGDGTSVFADAGVSPQNSQITESARNPSFHSFNVSLKR